MTTPAVREALSRATARVVGSRFAKPITRVALAAAGLLLLAFIGRTAVAGAVAPTPTAAALAASAAAASLPSSTPSPPSTPAAAAAGPGPTPASTGPPAQAATASPHGRASPDDPVILNTAGFDDLRRLPGIGEKRANAILALRTHLGRFRAVEDLLKVKGIGRATLKRLRPLVRLDPPPPAADAGPAAPR